MKRFYAGIVLNKDELKESNSSHIELEYYKISKSNKKRTNKSSNLYGIEIVKKEYLGKKKLKEKNNIYNLTNDENVVDKILNILTNNKVTPMTLNDIVEEILWV